MWNIYGNNAQLTPGNWSTTNQTGQQALMCRGFVRNGSACSLKNSNRDNQERNYNGLQQASSAISLRFPLLESKPVYVLCTVTRQAVIKLQHFWRSWIQHIAFFLQHLGKIRELQASSMQKLFIVHKCNMTLYRKTAIDIDITYIGYICVDCGSRNPWE